LTSQANAPVGWVIKTNAAGNPVSARQLGGGSGTDVNVTRIAMSSDNPVAVGYFRSAPVFNGTTLTSAGDADAFVTRMDP
jgi:hypothetical protein